jgi:2,3-bisphosphoglycerate-independent phosphoglycerate mutase
LRIHRAIDDRSFFDNAGLLQAAAHVIREKSTLHLMGLLTNHRSGHASPKHLKALVKFAEGLRLPRVALHLFTDGRDTHPFQAIQLVEELRASLPKHFVIASLIGRFYAMDRNRFWERTKLAYNLIVNGEGVMAEDPVRALTEAYGRGEGDEFLLPTVLCHNGTCVAPVHDGDALVFWNLRSDRARQLVKPFVMKEFESRESGAFHRHAVRKRLLLVTLTEFGTDLDHVVPAFPQHPVNGTLVEALRSHRQLYAAESEKFSQVTYFLNGGSDRSRFGEDRLRVPSKHVAKYNTQPRMSADELTNKLLKALQKPYDCIVANFANADMVAHTGDLHAGIKACEALDQCLGKLWKAVQAKCGVLLLTSDHGNIEQMFLRAGGPDTEHNPHPVPLLLAGSVVRGRRLRRGTLADVAPTMLRLLGVDVPEEMTGRNLLSGYGTR